MHRRALFASLAAVSALSACGMTLPFDIGGESGTLIVLRHAESSGEVLNEAGIARAATLPQALAGMPIDGIYAPDSPRDIDTATPLAEAKGLWVQAIAPVGIAAEMFKRQPGGTLVWVGDLDNIALLWSEIGAEGPPPVQYGELFIVPMTGLRAGPIEQFQFGP